MGFDQRAPVTPRTTYSSLFPPGFPIHTKALDETIGGFCIYSQTFGPRPMVEIAAALFNESGEKLTLSFPGSERVVVLDDPPQFGQVVSLS